MMASVLQQRKRRHSDRIEAIPRISEPFLILADQSSGEGVTEISDFDRT
jgi:hypothetical protein